MDEATPTLAAIVANWRIEHDGTAHEAGETFVVPGDVAERLVASGAAQPGAMPEPLPEPPPATDGDDATAEANQADAAAAAGDGSDAVAGTDPEADTAEKPRRKVARA